jgi:uncharacterized protein (TIGR03084 family)
MAERTADLSAETAALRALLVGLGESGWRRATPAEGWTVADQITHLAWYDDVAVLAATEPDRFSAQLRSGGEITRSPDEVAERHRERSGAAVLDWFDAARSRLIETFAAMAPTARLPWYGPDMAPASSVTARLMETWAHGQDVADALGAVLEPTDRLRHVAHLGVRTAGFSFAVRGLPVPTDPVRVELVAPSGAEWAWGPADAGDRVSGPALDFCLLVTQRRHRDDVALDVVGPTAERWMSVAQAFAGEPGRGRQPRAGAG